MDRAGPVSQDVVADVWRHLQARDQRPRPALPEGRGQLRIDAQGGDAVLYLYDEIGFWGVTAGDFVKQLTGVQAERITLHLSSPGGDVFDGIAIYNALRDHSADVSVLVDGLAASAASFIAQAGDKIVMNRASQLMIHDAWGFCLGNARDMGEMEDLLDRVSDTIAGLYAGRAGGDVTAWRAAMLAESWYTPAEAVEAGLADEAVTDDEAQADEDLAAAAAPRWDTAPFMFTGRPAAPSPYIPARSVRPAALAAGAIAALEGAFR